MTLVPPDFVDECQREQCVFVLALMEMSGNFAVEFVREMRFGTHSHRHGEIGRARCEAKCNPRIATLRRATDRLEAKEFERVFVVRHDGCEHARPQPYNVSDMYGTGATSV